MRAKSIANCLGIQLVTDGIQEIDATVNIAELYIKLFASHPSFIKVCDACNHQVVGHVSLLDDDVIYSKNFEEEAVKKMMEIPTACRKCKGNIWSISQLGRLFIHYVFLI